LGKDLVDGHDIGIYKSLQAISSKGAKLISKVMLVSQRYICSDFLSYQIFKKLVGLAIVIFTPPEVLKGI